MSARSLLIRGMLVGLAAGLVAFVFARIFGEPSVNAAISFEEAHEPAGPEMVSRAVQSSIGLATAVCLYGAALGGIFALVFAVVYGRVGRAGARATAAVLAGAGFVVVFAVPFLKYPANPPSVGRPDTIGDRTGLYFLMLALSVAAAVAGLLVRRSAVARWGSWSAAIAGMGTYVAIVAAAAFVLPVINEVPPDFRAAELWEFRTASLGVQLALWITIGLLFGALTERAAGTARPALAG